ncbi:VapE domain-containing protein, partial [Rubrivirga sp.]|uniref:VapE domain-containing protein n=1 Tax=Rubrivirga sp. TaxID=1885344 RepID=UPI003C77E516
MSIPGVSTGGKLGRLKPQLKKLCTYGRKVYLAFDRDCVYKRQVQNALHNLARMIMERGAMVYVLEWHDDFKGVDDYFAGCPGGMPLSTMLERAATLEEWRDALDSKAIELIDEPCKLAKRYAQVSERVEKRLRWNNLLDQMELDGQPFDPAQLRMFLALKHNVDIPLQDCQQICVFIAQQNRYSPIAEYLEDVAAEHGADDALLNEVASTYLGAGDDLHRAFLRKTLISAVARAMNPGCKVDTVCILVGDQGVGKSGFWEVLAGEWFDDSFGGGSDKDERLKLHRTWFVEWGELESIYKRRDVSSLKSFIACKKDSLRPPYGATTMDYLRPSIFVGTTNRDDFLADSTGNRRFWVVPVGIEAVPFNLLKENRDRIWAAAYHAFKAGEDWKLPKDLKQAAQETAQDYIFVDPWEQPVKDYIEGQNFVPTSDVLSIALGLELSQQGKGEEMRLADILRSLGWVKQRKTINGQKIRGWIFKSFGDEVGPVGPGNNELYQDVDEIRVTATDQPTDQPT